MVSLLPPQGDAAIDQKHLEGDDSLVRASRLKCRRSDNDIASPRRTLREVSWPNSAGQGGGHRKRHRLGLAPQKLVHCTSL